MKTVIANGWVVEPEAQSVVQTDVLIEDDRIVAVGDVGAVADCRIDATGCYVTPGLVDIHVHFRDPGFPEKETIASGARAAAAGGITSVVCMPNTYPTVDEPGVVEYVLRTAAEQGIVRVHTTASITKGLKGKEITEMPALAKAGAVTFTDDGKSVMDPVILLEAFKWAARLGLPITSHCEDHNLVRAGAINRGEVSKALGDVGIPSLAEELVVARDILFAEHTGARLHLQHVTTAGGVQLIREAKARGVRVTGEATPHHFSVTDQLVLTQGALAKVNPPLRTQADVDAVVAGLQDGTLDVIATDHAPHTWDEKQRGLQQAPFGFVGLETSVGMTFTHLVHTGKLSVFDAIKKMTVVPAQIMGLPLPRLHPGAVADITVINPNLEWEVDTARFYTRAKHSPLAGTRLRGKAVQTFVGGRWIYSHERGILE
ncbi:dihydroorotase [Alicyclobacillus fastidiosus]|uniref:Dihydroorotase n=1 Tax=Alicyclobacillus fastidiosus TaxID=392011 RepID=A0ABY6ZKU7_9BACL|nr:dihydroorotase [Alicyclobacillus fastidiosus]WAH43102.1 dihydroorotase [Alicyclobacillus fastidiosus]GMA65101.1 dihydroorotase [Alicyclobacillus fastidiosus]